MQSTALVVQVQDTMVVVAVGGYDAVSDVNVRVPGNRSGFEDIQRVVKNERSSCFSFRALRKRLSMSELGSRALRADAVESITCAWLSLVVVAALLAQLVTGAWWVDSAASLGIVWFLVREGREAW